MTEALDTSFVRVPFESLKRTTRDRKYAIDEVTSALEGIKGLSQAQAQFTLDSTQDLATKLEGYAQQLKTLKRKLDDIGTLEKQDAQRCRARLQCLSDTGNAQKDGLIQWSRGRIDRMLVDHLLRSGHYEAASQLEETSNLQDLTDMHIFLGSRAVTEGLQRHSCAEALAWCETNKARLKKSKSQLEFKLRSQEFIELVRSGDLMGAINYSKAHMSQWAPQYLTELQKAAATLAFRPGTPCSRYAALYAEERWQDLVEMFHSELYKLYSQPPVSSLHVHLEAGLSALKSPPSYQPGCSKEDPLHLPTFQKLAEGLPSAKHVHSKLICAITHEVMNEHNHPMVLPNGYVYSEKAMSDIAARNEGKIKCPCTGFVYNFSDLRRAYIS